MVQQIQESKVIRGRRHAARYTGIGTTQSWQLEKAGRWPRPIPLGVRARGWLRTELDAWLEERAAERDGGGK